MQLQKKLTAGEFVVLAEMEPPKGTDTVAMIANAWAVKGKVDAFVIPEMSNAVMKMSSLGGALLLQSRGLETVLQVCCRDRNRLALQGDLLAAQALGVPNVMAVAGEEITHGDHHKARAVYDLDLPELLGALQMLQSGRDMAGVDLQGSPNFFVGSTMKVTPRGEAWDKELAELDQKIAAGAGFFVTQPIFDPGSLAKLQDSLDARRAAVIPTVLLLKSVGMAKYINRHMDMKIPEEFINRIQKAPERVRECVQIAGELVSAFKAQGCPGVNISTIGWEDKLPGILAAAGI
ncbi:MAG: methylenetetrahydrofolate reductase [Deltaproteobacteria bacterium]|nr:methylenetetrahydrofolate reductase [Deltaproteobacteria bacterium]MBI4794738.1 methylenetetrahydrofolate reductase [Deltaproteobacteria bacterium]